MTQSYLIHASCDRPFISWTEMQAATPEEAVAKARLKDSDLLDAAEECNGGYPWDQFTVYDENGKELLRVLDGEARTREAAPAQAMLLDMLRYGILTLSDGEAEFEGVIYAFNDRDPDWRAVLDAIGEQRARAAVARAKDPAASANHD